jgi:hypothetical protein
MGREDSATELSGSSRLVEILGLEKFIEDGAILDHRSAEFFGGGFDAAWANGNGVGETIVFHYVRVGH